MLRSPHAVGDGNAGRERGWLSVRSLVVQGLRAVLKIVWILLNVVCLLAAGAALLGIVGFAGWDVALALRDVVLWTLGFEVARSPLALAAALLTLVVLGVTSLVMVWHFRAVRAPTRWGTARGVVTRTWVEEQVAGRSPTFKPVVEYTYTVAGRTHTSTHFWWLTPQYDDDRAAAEQNLAEHAPGSEIRVRYDSEDPSRSVVIHGAPSVVVLAVSVVAVMLVFSGTEGAARDAKVWATMFVVLLIAQFGALAWLISRTLSGVERYGSQ
jgi:hypothetical protein